MRGLVRGGLLDGDEASAIFGALDQVEEELAAGTFEFGPADEDIHTAVERRVTELAGPAGGKIHTGRSRNDQVATDLRLYTKRALIQVAIGRPRPPAGAAAAGPTPPATPTCPATRTCSGPSPSCSATTSWPTAGRWPATSTGCSPPTPAPTCRRSAPAPWPARRCRSTRPAPPLDLGFAEVFDNSLDAVSDRDFVAEALFDLALLGIHLSRIGEEVCLWASDEFGFLKLDDAYSTGSSMMPQKKNPDIAELARGKSGRLIGHLTGLLTTLKGLPMTYNRDLQEDKEPLFDAVDQVTLALAAMSGLLATSTFATDAMAAAADSPYAAATDLAELLVEGGTPFREAHAIVGEIVRRALDGEASMAELVAADPLPRRRRRRHLGARRLGHPAHHPRRCRPGAGGRPARAVPGPRRRRRARVASA